MPPVTWFVKDNETPRRAGADDMTNRTVADDSTDLVYELV